MNDFLSGASSIWSFIQRTVERRKNGCCWKTYDYENQPQYHYNVFNGVGGLPLFLAAYFKITSNPEALALAQGALDWCIADEPEQSHYQRGLQFGKTGIAYTALFLSEIQGRDHHLDFCLRNAGRILAEEPGPITDFIGGEASNGWFLMELWKKTRNDAFLEGAIRCGRWIQRNIIRDHLGAYCLMEPDGKNPGQRPYSGLAHGISGIACFFSALFALTGDEEWRRTAYELLETLSQHAIADHGGLNWSPVLGGKELTRCQYSHGAPGIGLAFVTAARYFNDRSLLEIGMKAGEATYHYGDFRNNPTLCTGLAGGGELMIELFRETHSEVWLRRAEDFARLAMSYRTESEKGDLWPTDTAGFYSADFTYGAAGTGFFLLRVLQPKLLNFPLMEIGSATPPS